MLLDYNYLTCCGKLMTREDPTFEWAVAFFKSIDPEVGWFRVMDDKGYDVHNYRFDVANQEWVEL